MATIVSIQQGGTGANNASDAVNALGTIANTGGIFTGEVQFTGSNNSINVANNALISGDLNVSSRGFFGNGLSDHIDTQGIDSSTITVAGFADTNGASEIMVINKSNGSLAYAEFIALNDKANQEQGWISVGINSSDYNDPDFTLTGPDDGYLLFEPPLNSNANGDLIIGTGSNGLNNHIKLAAGGFAPTDAQMIISPADLKTAEITNSELTSNVATLTTANTHTFLANDQVTIASVGVPYDGTFTITTVSSNTFSYAVANDNIGSAVVNGTATQYLPFNKGTVQLTAQLFVGENSKSTIETADITLAQGHAIPLGIVVDNDGPGQTVMFNKSNGTLAYSEFIAHNDAGNVEMGWISMGINSSGYDDPEFPITKADDAYLLYEPPANTSGDGDLIIGTGTNGTKNRLIFAAEGFDEANAQMIITPNESVRIAINTDASSANTGALQVEGGIGVQGSVFVQGNQTIQGDLIVNGSQVIQSIASVAASGPISLVGDGNQANTWDFGIVGTYATSKSVGSVAITNKELANNQATLSANNHGFAVEDYVVVVGVGAPFEGTHRITAATSNTFSYFKLANNISSAVASGSASVSSRAKYTGAIKDTANATWKLLSNIEARPDFNVNLANTSLDNLRVATINANSFVTATGINVGEQANNAYTTANNAVLKAGDTMTGVLNIANATALITTGNVGIGTTNPTIKLSIREESTGEVDLARFLTANGADIQFLDIGADATNNFVSFDVTGSSSGNYIFRSGGTERVRFTSSGNVGIGTTNPQALLQVGGTATGYPSLDITGSQEPSLYLKFGIGYAQLYNSYGTIGLNAYLNGEGKSLSSSVIYFQGYNDTANAYLQLFDSKIHIAGGGNVGIGTTVANQKLTVNGAIESLVDQYGGASEGGQLILRAPVGGSTRWNLDNFENNFRIFKENDSDSTGGAEYFRIVSNGLVGIATTNPGASLDVYKSTNDVVVKARTGAAGAYFVADSVDDGFYGMRLESSGARKWFIGGYGTSELQIALDAGGTELVRFKRNGNVGIGTTNPSALLHVKGPSIIADNSVIDPDSFSNQTVAGAVADGGGWAATSAIGGNAGTGDSWGIGHNGTNLQFGMQDGSATNTMQNYMLFYGNRNISLVPVSGNIGIGTTSPSGKLSIFQNSTNVTSSITTAYKSGGNSNLFSTGLIILAQANNSSSANTAAYIDFEVRNPALNGSHGTSGYIVLTHGSGTSFGDGQFDFYIRNNTPPYTFNNDSSATSDYWMSSVFTIKSDGNVGVGSTTPNAKLQVLSTSVGAALLLTGDSGNEQLVIQRYSNTNEQLIIGFHSSDYASIQAVEQNVAYRPLALNHNGGNVGIGVTNPGEKLQVQGNILIPVGNQLKVENPGGGRYGLFFTDSTGTQVSAHNGFGEPLTLNAPHSTAYMDLRVAGDSRMRIISNGNVGIGTTNPSTKLHVVGTSTFDKAIFNGLQFVGITGGRYDNVAAYDMFDITGLGGSNGTLEIMLAFHHSGGGRHGSYRKVTIGLNAYTDIDIYDNVEYNFGGGGGFELTRPNNDTLRVRWLGNSTFGYSYDLTGYIITNKVPVITNIAANLSIDT